MRYVIDVVVKFGRSWGVSGPPKSVLFGLSCRSGPVLYTLSYLILSYLILDILDIFVILGYLGHRGPGQLRRSGANRSPKGIPSKRASGTDFGPILVYFASILCDFWLICWWILVCFFDSFCLFGWLVGWLVGGLANSTFLGTVAGWPKAIGYIYIYIYIYIMIIYK